MIPEHCPKNKSGHQYNGVTYKQLYIPGHPDAHGREDSLVYEHRYLAVKALGKPLPKGVEVHHFDGGRTGGQLVICPDKLYHRLLHIRTEAYEETGDANKRKCAFCSQWDDVSNMIKYHSSHRTNGRYLHIECKREYERKYNRKKQ